MSSESHAHDRESSELLSLYAVHALPAADVAAVDVHLAGCADCRRELETLRPVIDAFATWPTNVLRPSPSLWDRLTDRISADTGRRPTASASRGFTTPDWEEAAPGIWCKLLATDGERQRVSLLVRLEPGVAYPPHEHAGVEELYLLDGELWIDDRKLHPGDYNRAEPGTGDQRVWSETGCTCVLLTSTADILR